MLTSATTAPSSFAPKISSLPLITSPPLPISRTALIKSRTTSFFSLRCQVAISTDVPSSSSSSSLELSDEEVEATSKVGRRVRVKVPLKVYHVSKAPELDLNEREGVIKQYVAIWKRKRISANLPFKVEFFVAVETQPAPVKVVAHLKEDEFELLEDKE